MHFWAQKIGQIASEEMIAGGRFQIRSQIFSASFGAFLPGPLPILQEIHSGHSEHNFTLLIPLHSSKKKQWTGESPVGVFVASNTQKYRALFSNDAPRTKAIRKNW